MTAIQTDHLWTAFADPVQDSQQCFRILMTAMSEPGRILEFPEAVSARVQDTALVSRAGYLTALTLLDAETSVFLGPDMNSDALRDNLRFHCGCPLVKERAEADFAFIQLAGLTDLDGFRTGTDEYPHQSCTLIIEVAALSTGDAKAEHSDAGLRLEGPGIPDQRALYIEGLSTAQQGLLEDNQRRYPLGVDLIFVTDSQVVAIPRSTRIGGRNQAASVREEPACMSQ